MAQNVLVLLRAGGEVLAVITSFARVPVPGEHILSKATPAIVRDTVLHQIDPESRRHMPNRWSPPEMKDHIADLFVEAITTESWRAKLTRWTLGGDQP